MTANRSPKRRAHKPRALLSWSSGKDSAWALHILRRTAEVEIVGLLTTLNAAFDRVAMHGVRRVLLEAQAEAAGLPLLAVPLPWPCSNAEYEAAMQNALESARAEFDATHVALGDLFLADVRRYREERMAIAGWTPLFPLWNLPTQELAREMIAGGLRAYLTCVDMRRLPAAFAGQAYDTALLEALPPDIDPCGEAGEFHTFACAGPMFTHPILVTTGEIVEREGFAFADILPGGSAFGRMSIP